MSHDSPKQPPRLVKRGDPAFFMLRIPKGYHAELKKAALEEETKRGTRVSMTQLIIEAIEDKLNIASSE